MPNSRAAAVEGESTRLKLRLTTISEAMYDPFSFEDVNLYSEDPTINSSAVAIATITPTKEVTGLWYVDYTFTSPGIYYDKWRFVSVDGDSTSEYVEKVVVNTLPTSTEKDWTLVATWEDELNTVCENISDFSKRINTADGSLRLDYIESRKDLRKYKREIELKIMQLNASAGNIDMIVPMSRTGFDV
jgi:hypothetical protein